MNLSALNPANWFARRKQLLQGERVHVRPGQGQGPYSTVFENYIAREVNPHLYEAIREALGPIDGAINMLNMLDGIIRVETESARLEAEIGEWMEGVRVGDLLTGYQAWYEMMGNERYEQGFCVGEWMLAKDKRDVARLNVADSKGIYFKRAKDGEIEVWYKSPAKKAGRRDGTDNIERVLRNNYPTITTLEQYLTQNQFAQLDPRSLIYLGYNNEAGNPYGTSIIRSTEFDAKVLLTMKTALFNTWDRFGDPIFNVVLKKKQARTGTERGVPQPQLDTERQALSNGLYNAMNAKRQGNSADLINVIGPNDELEITVLGADGQVLEVEMPARHILEQVVAKTGLPSWMLGFHWSTAERLAQRQGELALQSSRTRFANARPALRAPIEAMLRARGIAFKRGDWEIVQDLPSLQDILAQAQARFLNTQADMMEREGTTNPSGDQAPKLAKVLHDGRVLLPTDEGYDNATQQQVAISISGDTFPPEVIGRLAAVVSESKKKAPSCEHKAETYVEDEAELLRLERRAERDLLGQWNDLYTDTLAALDISDKTVKAPEPSFAFDMSTMLPLLRELENEFVLSVGADDAELARSMYGAWLRGIANASTELDLADEVAENTITRVQRELAANGFEQVRDTTLRAYRDDIVRAMEDGYYNGMNPREVAAELRKRFDAHDTDWQRLARSEIAEAQGRGKLDYYAEQEIEQYEWIRAGGACSICVGLAEGGPYPVATGPRPMHDSHPNCRCTVEAVIPEG